MRVNRIDRVSSTGVYHIYSRGTDKRPTFMDDSDHIRFMNRLYNYQQATVDIHCYCLMPNHFHLLVRADDCPTLSSFMHRLLTAYTVFFNKKYDRTGHLFQSRYQSKAVESAEYYEQVVEYIWQNPTKLGIDPAAYPWVGGPIFSKGQALGVHAQGLALRPDLVARSGL